MPHDTTPARSEHTALTAMVNLARTELPDAANLGAIAMMSPDGDVARQMLSRLYGAALDADCGYIAELADRALGAMERCTTH